MRIIDKDDINPTYNRDLFYICENYVNSDESRVLTITGLRRLGKTTILKTINNKYSNSTMITLDNMDTTENILDFIEENLNKYDIFLIDEICLTQEVFNNCQIIFDYLINHRKKAIITGTYNLSILYLEKDQSYGRTINYTLSPLTYLEFINIYGKKGDNYLEYINFTDFSDTNEEDYIESIIENISLSYNKYVNYNSTSDLFSKNKIKFYILLILFKMVMQNDIKLINIVKAEGISKFNKINEEVVDYFRIKSDYYDDIIIGEFNLIIENLTSLQIIKNIPSLYGSNIEKNLILNYVLKRYIYNIIESKLNNTELKSYKMTHYGLFYENIMNMQVSIYSEHTFDQFYYKNNIEEIDDIIMIDNELIFIDYKSGAIQPNYIFTNNIDKLKNISRTMYNCSFKELYVGGQLNSKDNIKNDLDFLQELRSKYIGKFKTDKTKISNTSINLFNWE